MTDVPKRIKNFIGVKFGNCGTTRIVSGLDLRDGTSKSCGCLARELSRQRCGPLSVQWRHDITKEERQQIKDRRADNETTVWRREVFELDNYTCRCCGTKKSPFNAHHLNGWNWAIEQRHDVNNGLTLCENCHILFHKNYGCGNNTKEQYQEFFFLRYNG